MNHQLKTRALLALFALLLVSACSSESNQNQPVTTTTNAGTSSAPPATEVKQRGNARSASRRTEQRAADYSECEIQGGRYLYGGGDGQG